MHTAAAAFGGRGVVPIGVLTIGPHNETYVRHQIVVEHGRIPLPNGALGGLPVWITRVRGGSTGNDTATSAAGAADSSR